MLIEEYKPEISALKQKLEDAAQKTAQAVTQLKEEVGIVHNLEQRLDDLEVMVELALEEPESGMEEELEAGLEAAKAEIEHLELGMLLNGEYDANNAILTLHAGAGGDEAGVKSATLQINGHNAYGYLRSEKGVHRLVRISPFDANARRHTSFAAVDVMPELDDTVDIKIDPSDLKVDTYRASGAGGQHVNKTSSAVRMTHIPTGIIVQCQNERSQIQNRERCMQLLRAKLYEYERAKQEALKNDIAGDYQDIEWGSQIRSYVFQPYKMVKDHRTGAETGNVQAVMDGGLDMFIEAYLRSQQKKI